MPTKRQQQKEETARRIFEAAIVLFREQGFDATTVEAITVAAGVAKGTFFSHFPSKEAVLGHLGEMQMERLHAMIAAREGFAELPLREQLRQLFATMAGNLEHQPEMMRGLTVEILRHSLFDTAGMRIDALDTLLAELLAAAQRRGELRDDADLASMTALVRGTYFLALFSWLKTEGQRLTPLTLQYLDLLLEGLTVT